MACAGFPTVAWWTSGRIFARCGVAPANRLFVWHVADRHRIHLVPVLVDDRDEPSLPTSARHRLAMPEFFRQHHRLLTRRGVARQVHSLRVFQAFSPIRHMKIIPRHRVLTPAREARLRYTLYAVRANGLHKSRHASSRQRALIPPTRSRPVSLIQCGGISKA